MAFGIILIIAALIGIIYGVRNKNKPLGLVSVIVLIMTIAIGIYFYINPY